MDAEFSVELGADDPTLAVPWRSPDGHISYLDLRSTPEAIEQVVEVRAFPELRELLQALNASGSPYQTAKCDAWFDTLMDVDDEPYGAAMKCACYVDVFFGGLENLAPFNEHEQRAQAVVQRLRQAEDVPARIEVIVRRAFFQDESGFYWTVYVFGYGDDMDSARSNWNAALTALRNALQT